MQLEQISRAVLVDSPRFGKKSVQSEPLHEASKRQSSISVLELTKNLYPLELSHHNSSTEMLNQMDRIQFTSGQSFTSA